MGVKKSSIQIWWELYDKHEDDLVKLEQFDNDEDDILDKAGVTKPKKSKGKGKKKKKAAKTEQPKEEL